MQQKINTWIVGKHLVMIGIFLLIGGIILAGCGGPATETVVRETVEVEGVATAVVTDITPTSKATGEITETATLTDTTMPDRPAVSGQFTTPHPILSVPEVRQAIAHCTNRLELIESVYPFLEPEERENLLMDTFIPRGHWAEATENITRYPFDPERGSQLLESAGWTLEPGQNVRTDSDGNPLQIGFLTTDAQFRQTWAAVLEQQLLDHCGIQLIRTHAPASHVFGETSGLSRREFELAGFAWVGSVDPKGTTLYPCHQVPLPTNNWEGQNYMGWCNERASKAIIAANSTLNRDERIRQYGIVQEEFTKDMVSLPLFNRLEAAAATTRLKGLRPDPTESYIANIDEWELTDGGDEIVIGLSQEPTTFFGLVESSSNTRLIGSLISFTSATGYSYDYQAEALLQLPTLENGGAVLEAVEVKEGDIVWTTDAEAVPLAPGVEIQTMEGEPTIYEGGSITLPQLTVTFEYTDGLTWEDGTPVTQADFELTHRINCDKTSGATSYNWCDSLANVEFLSDTSYTITYVPGALWPEYSVYGITSYGLYPAHRVLGDGRLLADVPASEWSTLVEVAERPLSTGPYRIVDWQKGQRMTFEANPYYYKGEPPIKRVTLMFFKDTNQAVAQLLSGSIDVLGSETLAAGPELETVLVAAQQGRIQAYQITSPTWEHLDMNLFVP